MLSPTIPIKATSFVTKTQGTRISKQELNANLRKSTDYVEEFEIRKENREVL